MNPMNDIKWDKSGLPLKIAVVELCGWCNKNGTANRLGKQIASKNWEKLSPASKNVLKYHGINQ